jgi:hypothetical protein
MWRRVLTSKSLKYSLGLALLLHPPATAKFQSKPAPLIHPEHKLKSPWLWELSAHSGSTYQPQSQTYIYTGWRALHKAMTLPLKTSVEYGHVYDATSLPAIMLRLRYTQVGRRPIGGY